MPVKSQNLVSYSLPGWYGLVTLWLAFYLLHQGNLPSYLQAAIIIGAMFAVMFCVEAAICFHGKFGLITNPCQRKIQLNRVFFKIVGWAITVGLVASAYWLFPEYAGSFYNPYYQALLASWPYLAAFFLCCIFWEDTHSNIEFDDYYWLAYGLFNFKFDLLGKVKLKQHFLGWVVKLYFLPLMFVYLVGYINYQYGDATPFNVFDSIYNGVYFIDTAFVCVGYIFANNLTDTQIRSTDPTMFGWVICLICYQPFWSLISSSYISYGSPWGPWLSSFPALQVIWGFLIILCLLLYVWATITFGTRFSNLTHRGILMCGPYAYLRHPAYVAKLTSFFLLYVPFVGKDWFTALRSFTLWALLAGVYYLRAKTEEAHLRSVGPEYDIYAKQVTENWKKLLRL